MDGFSFFVFFVFWVFGGVVDYGSGVGVGVGAVGVPVYYCGEYFLLLVLLNKVGGR